MIYEQRTRLRRLYDGAILYSGGTGRAGNPADLYQGHAFRQQLEKRGEFKPMQNQSVCGGTQLYHHQWKIPCGKCGDILLYRPHDIHYGDIPYEQMIEYFELLFEPAALACLTGGDALVRLFAERVSEQQPIVLLRPDAERLKSLNESFYRLLNCLRRILPMAI
ncbi:MAG: hypothetical protein ACLR4A_19630 [Christensenellales bacterium]